MFAACLTSHLVDVPPAEHPAHGFVAETVVGLTRCRYFPVQCILSPHSPCSLFSLRETKCKMLTLKQRCHLPGDTKGSPTVWGSEPFVVIWVTTTTATRSTTATATSQAALQHRWPALRLIFYSPLKRSLARKQSTERCIPRRGGHLLHLSQFARRMPFSL